MFSVHFSSSSSLLFPFLSRCPLLLPLSHYLFLPSSHLRLLCFVCFPLSSPFLSFTLVPLPFFTCYASFSISASFFLTFSLFPLSSPLPFFTCYTSFSFSTSFFLTFSLFPLSSPLPFFTCYTAFSFSASFSLTFSLFPLSSPLPFFTCYTSFFFLPPFSSPFPFFPRLTFTLFHLLHFFLLLHLFFLTFPLVGPRRGHLCVLEPTE